MTDPPRSEQHSLFISYASVDRDRVLEIVDSIRSLGVEVWLDHHGIEGGANWAERIAQAIEGSAAFVLMSSAASLASRNVRSELGLAWRSNKPIVPLLLDATPTPMEVRYFLELAQWIEVLEYPVDAWLPKMKQALVRLEVLTPTFMTPESAPTGQGSSPSQHAIPTPLTTLVGREDDVTAVLSLLAGSRLVTLTGSGGIGKTRISLAVGRRMEGAYRDGVVFVELAPITDPTLVLSTIAAQLNVREAVDQPTREQLARALHSQRVLLLLDNLEQIIDVASDLAWLVARCPTLAILSTSREPLRVSGEVEYSVAALPVPYVDAVVDIDELRANPTVALFVQRVRNAKPDFDVTVENATTVVAICAQLDGIPLAIELAAARMKALTPQALLERLGDPLRLLTGGARDLPGRQRTIRDTIQWSFDLLPPDEQRLLSRLSVFAGGWTLDAAEAVVNGDGSLDLDVLDGLMSLSDKSLVTQREQPNGETRYALLTTIREFAGERLDDTDRLDDLFRALANYFVERLEGMDPSLHDISMYDVVQFADQEYPNLHVAIRWAWERDARLAARLIVALHGFWIVRGRWREGYNLATAVLSDYSEPDALRARLICTAAITSLSLGDRPTAIRLAEDATTIARSQADDGLLALTLWQAGLTYLSAGDIDRAAQRYEEGLLVSETHGDPSNRLAALVGIGLTAVYRGDLDLALDPLEQAVSLVRDFPDRVLWGPALTGLAHAVGVRGEHERALDLYREVITQPEEFAAIGFIVVAIEGIASIVAASDAQHATTLLGAARAVRDRVAYGMFARRLDVKQLMGDLRETLGADAFAEAWERGQHLSFNEAKVLALGRTDV